MSAVLSIENLHVTFRTRSGLVHALRGVSLDVNAGETLGVVGESGSGKSVTALAAMGLLARSARITGGAIRFRGQDITGAPAQVLRPLRGSAMSMIFQNPRGALNPIRPVGLQIADTLRAHGDISWSQARARALALLQAVQIRDAERRVDAYPGELSGGMCQRVMIAIAMACEPALLLADEPTTGLDVTTQKTVMDLLAELCRARGMAMVLITHDLGLAAQYCRRIAVMEQGQNVEDGAPAKLFSQPAHRYTRRLVAASPTRVSTVASLVGETDISAERPPGDVLLRVEGLTKRYANGKHLGVTAVDSVSFTVRTGESVGLVGESGSGKSTIARMICRLLDQSAGKILFAGQDIGAIPERGFHKSPLRADIQIVFQDPADSLNPRFTVFDCIADPLRRLTRPQPSGAALTEKVRGLAVRVGLPVELIDRFPHQLSGGQQARVGIARAIATGPRLLVLDEPTAALDVSVQAVILQLLDRLRREESLATLFVSHDLNVVRMMCARTIVLQHGRIVEQGDSQALFSHPQADYTRTLLDAVPHFTVQPASQPPSTGRSTPVTNAASSLAR
jgi:peptide/nickel transport system ATP-binding protein